MVFNWKEFNQRPERKKYMKEYLANWRANNQDYIKNYSVKYRKLNRDYLLYKKKEWWNKVKKQRNSKRRLRWAKLSTTKRKIINKKYYKRWKISEDKKRKKLGLPTTDENRQFKNLNQKKLYFLYKTIFPKNEVEMGVYPEWLTNPKTGRKMELDILDIDVNVAIERQGIQHYKKSKIFKYDNLKNIQYRDRLKEKICKNNGIKLIKFRYNEPHTMENLIKKLRKVGVNCKVNNFNPLINSVRNNFDEK